MSLQQAVQPRSAANGFGRRRTEKDGGPRLDSKMQTVKANPSRSSSVGGIANLNLCRCAFSPFLAVRFSCFRQRGRICKPFTGTSSLFDYLSCWASSRSPGGGWLSFFWNTSCDEC